MSSLQKVATLTIPNGGVASNELGSDQLRPLKSISIQAPAVLAESVTVRSADIDAAAGATYAIIQSPPGTDVVIAAGKTIVLTELPFGRIRLGSLAVAADRVFEVWGRV